MARKALLQTAACGKLAQLRFPQPVRCPGTATGRNGGNVTADSVRRRRPEVLGFGLAAVLYLPGVAYLGITNGHRFIPNSFFASMYCLAGVGFAAVPLLTWRPGSGRYTEPQLLRSAWFPWAYTTLQGVAYSSLRSDANVFTLFLGWGMFIFPGTIALYFLGSALWGSDGLRAVGNVGGAEPAASLGGLLPPQSADTFAADARTAAPVRVPSAHSTGPSLPPPNTAPACYEAWRQQIIDNLDQAVPDRGEQKAWQLPWPTKYGPPTQGYTSASR